MFINMSRSEVYAVKSTFGKFLNFRKYYSRTDPGIFYGEGRYLKKKKNTKIQKYNNIFILVENSKN